VGSGVRPQFVQGIFFSRNTAMMQMKKSWLTWVRQLWRGPGLPITRPRNITSRLLLECLEDRLAPATLTVTTATDQPAVVGKVSLREAIVSIDAGADLNADVTANRVGNYGTNDTIIFNIGNGN